MLENMKSKKKTERLIDLKDLIKIYNDMIEEA